MTAYGAVTTKGNRNIGIFGVSVTR